MDVKVTQEQGFVYMQFVDSSECEEAFAIQRKDKTENYLPTLQITITFWKRFVAII